MWFTAPGSVSLWQAKEWPSKEQFRVPRPMDIPQMVVSSQLWLNEEFKLGRLSWVLNVITRTLGGGNDAARDECREDDVTKGTEIW